MILHNRNIFNSKKSLNIIDEIKNINDDNYPILKLPDFCLNKIKEDIKLGEKIGFDDP